MTYSIRVWHLFARTKSGTIREDEDLVTQSVSPKLSISPKGARIAIAAVTGSNAGSGLAILSYEGEMEEFR
jgi:hypothetical protein